MFELELETPAVKASLLCHQAFYEQKSEHESIQ